MNDRILQLCKRLNKFTLDKIVTISEIPEDKLLPVLNKLIIENKLSLENNIYSYKKKQKVSDKYSIFKYYPKATIDTIIKCFCEFLRINYYDQSFTYFIYRRTAGAKILYNIKDFNL